MAAAQIYRSVKLVVQNNTNESLTVQGFAVLSGAWADKMAPQQGMLVGEQATGEWSSVSTTLGSGTGAFVRFGCSRGYLMIRWSLPWAGKFEHFQTEVPGMRLDMMVEHSHSDGPILLATLSEDRS